MTLERTCNNILYISAQRVTVLGRNTEFSHICVHDKQESYPSLRHRIRNINVCLTFFFNTKLRLMLQDRTVSWNIAELRVH